MNKIIQYFDTAVVGIEIRAVVVWGVPLPCWARVYGNEAAGILAGLTICAVGMAIIAVKAVLA